jgi:Flp pilus assembly protein TadD
MGDTVLIALMLAAAFILPSVYRVTRDDIFSSFVVFMIGLLLLALFHFVRLVFGADVLTLGVFTSLAESPAGKWNDVGILFGLGSLLSLLALDLLPLSRAIRPVVVAFLAVSLLLVLLVNFVPVYIVVGVCALALALYQLLTMRQVSWFSIAVVVVMVLGYIFTRNISSFELNTMQFSTFEARPSWASMMSIGREVSTLPLGTGPNTFELLWDAYRPADLNATIFWNAEFRTGVATIPTAFVTTGIPGILAWVIFLLGVLWLAASRLFFRTLRGADRFVVLGSLIAGLYVLLFALIYVPSSAVLLIGFAFLGFAAAGTTEEAAEQSSTNVGFILYTLLAVLLIASCATLYFVGTAVMSSYFSRSAEIAMAAGDMPTGEMRARTADSIFSTDETNRLLTRIALTRLQSVVATETGESEESQTRFKDALGSAVAFAQRAAEYSPNDYRNWSLLMAVYQSVVPLGIEGAHGFAVAAYDRARVLNPLTPALVLERARLAKANNTLTEARTFAEDALRLKPDYVDALLLLAELDIAGGQIQAAIERAESAGQLESSNPLLRFQIGVLKFESGDRTGSKADFERAIALSDEYANAHFYLARVLFLQGDVDGALRELTRVKELDPSSPDIDRVLSTLRAGGDPFADL